jgi:hypothetical protein
MNNYLNIYYKPVIDFLNNLNYKFVDDPYVDLEVVNRFEEKLSYETLDFNFRCKNDNKISFCISLSYEDSDSPRLAMLLKKPESEEFYEIIDEYLNEKDNDIESLIKYIKCILSNEFKVVYSFSKGNKIRENYFYSIIVNNVITKINDLGYKKGIVFPWNKKLIETKIYEFEPWIVPDGRR